VRGGFQRFYNRLAQRVTERGGTLKLGTQIQRIETADGGLGVTFAPVGIQEQGETARYDLVVSTLPTRLTCQLTPELSADYRARYEWGRAYGAHCLILALDRPMTSSYWMNVNDPGFPFMVFVEHTNYMPPEDYGGRHLVYLGNYRAMDDPLFRMSKDEVLGAFLPHLSKINPAFDPTWVTESWMFAAPYAQPIVTTDYRKHIPPFDTPIKGLYVANMFQVYPHDRGQNYSIELAERLIRHLDERLIGA
jgi:protoporphyrinogen oxidase